MILTVRAEGNLCGAVVYVNGKRLKFKTDENLKGTYSVSKAEIETDGQVELSVIKRSPFGYKKWFRRVAVFWLLGIFGLFTPRYKKQNISLDYKLKANLTEDAELVLRVTAPTYMQTDSTPVLIGSTAPFEEEDNCWFSDMVAKKRRKFYHIFNAVFWILLAVALAVIFISIAG